MGGLASSLATPFFTGAGLALDVPGRWDCAINGRGYMIDWKFVEENQFTQDSIPMLRPQSDTSDNVAERSFNPEESARRAAESWHHGAGQTRHDRPDSDPYRFRTSKGVDVFTKWAMGMLNDTTLQLASAFTNLALMPVGTRIYLLDGTALRYSTDLSFGSSVSSMSATAGNGIASDGFNVYTAHGADGIYKTDTSTGAATHWNTRVANGIIAYVKGRLIVSNDNVLVNVTGAATETILLTHPNTGFRWTCAGEGPGFIYAAGYAGDKCLIYKTAVQQDALALASPTVAGELPDGEVARSVQGYLGYLLVGTDKGLRLMALDGSGNIDGAGRVVPSDSPVYCLEPQDRFVYYGLTNYDSVSTGLGRVDLSEFTDTLTPAYASDLMATTQGTVLSVVTFGGVRVFAVSGVGVYGESSDKVPTGTLDSGVVAFGAPDTKVAMYLDTRFEALVGSVTHAVSSDGGSFATLETASTASSKSMISSAGQVRAETFEMRHTLARSSSDHTLAPTVTRWTLEASLAPGRGEYFDVPLLLFEHAVRDEAPEWFDPAVEKAALLSAEALGLPVSYQDGVGTVTVLPADHRFIVHSYTEHRNGWNGTYVARLRRPRARS